MSYFITTVHTDPCVYMVNKDQKANNMPRSDNQKKPVTKKNSKDKKHSKAVANNHRSVSDKQPQKAASAEFAEETDRLTERRKQFARVRNSLTMIKMHNEIYDSLCESFTGENFTVFEKNKIECNGCEITYL